MANLIVYYSILSHSTVYTKYIIMEYHILFTFRGRAPQLKLGFEPLTMGISRTLSPKGHSYGDS